MTQSQSRFVVFQHVDEERQPRPKKSQDGCSGRHEARLLKWGMFRGTRGLWVYALDVDVEVNGFNLQWQHLLEPSVLIVCGAIVGVGHGDAFMIMTLRRAN